MFFIEYAFHVFAGRVKILSLALQDRCNIEIFLSLDSYLPCMYCYQPFSCHHLCHVKTCVLFTYAALYSSALQTNFIMEANSMSHDQTLIWAKSVCNTGHQRKKLDERAEDKVVFNLFLPFMIHNRCCLFSHLLNNALC